MDLAALTAMETSVSSPAWWQLVDLQAVKAERLALWHLGPLSPAVTDVFSVSLCFCQRYIQCPSPLSILGQIHGYFSPEVGKISFLCKSVSGRMPIGNWRFYMCSFWDGETAPCLWPQTGFLPCVHHVQWGAISRTEARGSLVIKGQIPRLVRLYDVRTISASALVRHICLEVAPLKKTHPHTHTHMHARARIQGKLTRKVLLLLK